MKQIRDLKIGDVVSCISRDPRHNNVETTVESIGRKYIKVANVNYSYKVYERETLLCVNWSSWELFLGSLDEYAQYVKDSEKRKATIERIQRQLKELELSQLENLADALQNIITPQSKG